MPFIVELIISVCILIGIYTTIASLLESPRIISYVKHLHEQFEENLYGDKIDELK